MLRSGDTSKAITEDQKGRNLKFLRGDDSDAEQVVTQTVYEKIDTLESGLVFNFDKYIWILSFGMRLSVLTWMVLVELCLVRMLIGKRLWQYRLAASIFMSNSSWTRKFWVCYRWQVFCLFCCLVHTVGLRLCLFRLLGTLLCLLQPLACRL